MKKIFIVFWIFITLNAISKSTQGQNLQIWKYRIDSIMMRVPINGTWSEWVVPSYSNEVKDALVVIDLIHKKVDVYTQKEGEYSVIKVYPVRETKEAMYIDFDCIDLKNEKCSLLFTFYKFDRGHPTLYQTYPTFEIIHFLKPE